VLHVHLSPVLDERRDVVHDLCGKAATQEVRPDFTELGVRIGHATDVAGGTGCTVVLGADGPLRGGVAVLGRASGTRELHTLAPEHVADRVDAVLLTGGSAYGLDAAAGVMRWMEERHRGFPVGGAAVVPIVPAACLFDLFPCGSPDARPTVSMAYQACERAVARGIEEGSVGAGTGATVGKGLGVQYAMKGGLGCGVAESGGVRVGAVVAVNALGDVSDGSGKILAGARSADGRWLDQRISLRGGPAARAFGALAATSTTLAVVVASVALSRIEVKQLARASGAALGRRISPVGTSYDGDVIVALCPHESPTAAPPLALEVLAVAALEEAIERAVTRARGRDGVAGAGDGI
jgi:L-aminopeptidase/D-esterase-like protein